MDLITRQKAEHVRDLLTSASKDERYEPELRDVAKSLIHHYNWDLNQACRTEHSWARKVSSLLPLEVIQRYQNRIESLLEQSERGDNVPT